jgi:exportin-T
MKDPAEKIQLFSVLSIVAGLTPLEEKTRDAQSDPNVQEFRERAAKLLNSFGIELGKIVVPEALAEDKTKAEAEVMLENCLPLFLRFLGDNSNDTSQAVFGMLDDLLKRVSHSLSRSRSLDISASLSHADGRSSFHSPLSLFLSALKNKKAKKTDILVLSESKHAFFTSLLEVIIKKMEWDRDADWSLGEDDGDADPDDVLIFQTLRKVRLSLPCP